MTRLFLGCAFVAVLAFSLQAGAVHAHTQPHLQPATWTVAGSQDLQTADLHTLVGFHALHSGF